MLRDLRRGGDPQISAIRNVVAQVDPDVLVLTDFDYDLDGLALAAFAAEFAEPYETLFALPPNAGQASGFDLDGNGYLGDARDAFGYGRFAGDGGLAILSRYAIEASAVRDFSELLWSDLPGAQLPQVMGQPFPSAKAQAGMRLSSTGHWIVPVGLPDGPPLSLMVFAATPPVFDGPEDANGLRNRDELRLWQAVLDGQFGPAPESFAIAGNANLDPDAGQGLRAAMTDFLADPRLQDPLPGQPTADWGPEGPGKLRVSYLLPSTDWEVLAAGVFRPAAQVGEIGATADRLSGPHDLVWVDLSRSLEPGPLAR